MDGAFDFLKRAFIFAFSRVAKTAFGKGVCEAVFFVGWRTEILGLDALSIFRKTVFVRFIFGETEICSYLCRIN